MESSRKKVIIACDSFKGTLTAVEVCSIIGEGMLSVDPTLEIIRIPVADGGEGTVDSFLDALGGELKTDIVKSPLMNDTKAAWAICGDGIAVIETAQASGINTDSTHDAMRASSYGTGEIIKRALDSGSKNIYIGLGGSATTDGGVGLLSALGVHFLDENGEQIPWGGAGLEKIVKIDASDMDKRLLKAKITALCDVTNPLFGQSGAAYVFSPQKGATPEQVEILDRGLRNFARVCSECGVECSPSFPGSGAAGGLGFGLMAFAGAELKSGIDAVLDLTDFDALSRGCELVVTGEGKLDSQSFGGKVPSGVVRRSGAKRNIAVVGICEADRQKLKDAGFYSFYESNEQHRPFAEIKDSCREDLFSAAQKACEAL